MINFCSKKQTYRGRGVIASDVVITQNSRSGKKSLSFSFSEKAMRVAFPNSKRALVGFSKDAQNKIFFKAVDSLNGYTLSKRDKKGGTRSYSSFGGYFDANIFSDFVGDYNLEYDAENELFCIDKRHKLEV